MAIVRNNFIVIICCLSFFFMLTFVLLGYINAQATVEKTPSNNEKNIVIKIPPPIEGLILQEQRKAQSLKKTKIALLGADGNSHEYTVELAVTPEEQRIGMMFRNYIPENTGMLFVFKEDTERNFWMKNTFIPLDLIFIRNDGIITYIHHMAEEESLKPINSNGKVRAVLEIAGGEAEILNINIGDRVLYKDF